MTKYTIRAATAHENFAAIQRLYLKTWQDAYRDILPAGFLGQLNVTSWHPEERWQHTFLAFNQDQQVVGVCSYGPARKKEFSGFGEVYSIYVDADVEGQGIGTQLLQAAIKKLHESYAKIYLIVLVANDSARQFYGHNGFQPSGEPEITATPYGNIREIAYIREETGQ